MTHIFKWQSFFFFSIIASSAFLVDHRAFIFNCTSFWPRRVAFFACQVQAQMRHSFHFRACPGQDICRIDMRSGDYYVHIWEYSFYYWKHTHKWNYKVVSEQNGNNYLFILILTLFSFWHIFRTFTAKGSNVHIKNTKILNNLNYWNPPTILTIYIYCSPAVY